MSIPDKNKVFEAPCGYYFYLIFIDKTWYYLVEPIHPSEGTQVAGTPDKTRRVLLKLSGAAFGEADLQGHGLDLETIKSVANQISVVAREDVQVAVVCGGGNQFRGAELEKQGMDRPRADYMGMLGTVINCLALQDFIDKTGIETRVQTSIAMGQVAEPYIPRRAIRHLEKGRVVIFGAGLGAPFFSTDTTAAQRGLEIGVSEILVAKNGTDGVYDCDPRTNQGTAKRFWTLGFQDALEQRLGVMDSTALSLCMDNHLPIKVFDMNVEDNIARALRGEALGTLVSTDVETTFASS
jgi:uridylate kinase